jgi:NADH-quinone oxidoreductase subunit M
MLFSDSHILSTILFTPLVGAILMLFIPSNRPELHRSMGNLFGFLGLAVSLPLIWRFNSSMNAPRFQFVTDSSWIPSVGAHFTLGIDGLSYLLVMLTTVLGPLAILSSWSAIKKREKEYYILLLLLQTGMLGVFMSLDFVLFYVFWEVMLVPMYFLIGVWGSERRLYAAIKFFLYTLAGSVLMLLAILAIYYYRGTFDIREILVHPFTAQYGWLQKWLFWGFFFAFAIKVPMFPFHTWLPDAHTEAPTAGSVILAGVLLKMGTYGFLRFSVPMFPDATVKYRRIIIVLSLIGIVYGEIGRAHV